MIHKPVLLKEVLEYLNPKSNENFIDCTIGEGGHTVEILNNNGPLGKVLGIDIDENQIKNAKENTKKFGSRIVLINDSYSNLKEIVNKTNFGKINGILLDLGMSSWQLEKSGKGFSFQKDEFLDMRYDLVNQKTQNYLTAEKILNEYPEREIENILKEFGQERFAKKIAKEVIEQRKLKRIKTTFELKSIVEKSIPKKFQRGKIHCATRSFQALRIVVNQELDNLKFFLPQAMEILEEGGRLVIISFHSLEDRIVKNFFKEEEKKLSVEAVKKAEILTKKPIIASRDEVLINLRSRSAKLRAILKGDFN